MKILISIPYYGDYKNLQNEACAKGVQECLDSKEFDFKVNITSGAYISRNRNQLILEPSSFDSEGFIDLKTYKIRECDYFLFVDHDIEFNLAHVKHLLSQKKANIGLPYRRRGLKDVYNVEPQFYGGLHKVNGQGMGFRLIKRDVFERLEPFWFLCDVQKFENRIRENGEDYYFDAKCRGAGIDVWCDFNKPVNHKIGVINMEKNQLTASQIARSITNNVNNLADAVDQLNALVAEKDAKIKDLESKQSE